MLVRKVDIWHLNLAFLYPIKHSLATYRGSQNIVVKVTTGEGLVGYGEGLPRAFVTGETLAESLAFLQEELAPAVVGLALTSPEALFEEMDQACHGTGDTLLPAACCALETALLDAAGKTWNRPVSDFFGPLRQNHLHYSAVLPMVPEAQIDQALQLVKRFKMHYVKLKVGHEADLDMVRRTREELGEEVDLRVDANSAWTAEEAIERLRLMAPYRLSAVEQPVAKEDFQGLKQVQEALGIPVIADESLCTEEDARQLIDLQACRVFNIRLSKCGGFRRAARIRRLAEEAGMPCILGCHVGETSILSAAGRHFALTTANLAHAEGSLSGFLLTRDPVDPPVGVGEGGLAYPLPGSGLGIRVLDTVLDELAVSRWTIS